MPFMKASSVLAPKKTKKEAPDLEEAIEESDDGDPVDEAPDETEEASIDKDKYIKAPKKKAAAAKAKPKGKKRAIDDDAEESEAKKPAKGKGRAKK
jgi:replication factor C subunit 1